MIISFDVGGVLDEGADVLRPLVESLVLAGHKVIVVTAIGHGKPEKWGFSEDERYQSSEARLIRRGYNRGSHWHNLFVTPDPDSGPITGRYKDYVLKQQKASLHVDDNERVMSTITCKQIRFHTKMNPIEFLSAFDRALVIYKEAK
jgi:hypothetical protein